MPVGADFKTRVPPHDNIGSFYNPTSPFSPLLDQTSHLIQVYTRSQRALCQIRFRRARADSLYPAFSPSTSIHQSNSSPPQCPAATTSVEDLGGRP